MAKIPIDDASEARDDNLADDVAQEADGAAADVDEGVIESGDEADESAGESDDARGDDADGVDADDLVAEAEAIVEEASAADQLEAAQREAGEWHDRYLRLHAEWDTYRRRTSEQRAEEKARATEKLVEDLIPVLDDFERTVSYAEENGEAGLLDGVKAVQAKLIGALTKSGLTIIDPVGEAYNALEAQAVGTVPDAEAYDETVHDVYQKGYKMGKKVLRAAMVTVTTGGAPRPKDDAEEDR